MAYKELLTNKITIPNQIEKEKVNSIIDGFRECIDIVYHEPRVIAESIRHGHWISDRLCSTNGGTYGVRRCSNCEYYYNDFGDEWNYCPHCGASMDEVEE